MKLFTLLLLCFVLTACAVQYSATGTVVGLNPHAVDLKYSNGEIHSFNFTLYGSVDFTQVLHKGDYVEIHYSDDGFGNQYQYVKVINLDEAEK